MHSLLPNGCYHIHADPISGIYEGVVFLLNVLGSVTLKRPDHTIVNVLGISYCKIRIGIFFHKYTSYMYFA